MINHTFRTCAVWLGGRRSRLAKHFSQKYVYRLIAQPVVDVLPILLIHGQTSLAQDSQLLGYIRLRTVGNGLKMAQAAGLFPQRIQDL